MRLWFFGLLGSVSLLLFPSPPALAAGDRFSDEASKICPTQAPQNYRFDNRGLAVDSVVVPQPARKSALLVYCLKVDSAPKSPYLVDWPDANFENIGTQDGFLGAVVREVDEGDPLPLEPTTLFIGSNRTKFTPNVRKEATLAGQLKTTLSRLLSRVIASIPDGPLNPPAGSPPPSQFSAVDFAFMADELSQTADQSYEETLSFIDFKADTHPPLRLGFAPDVSASVRSLSDNFTITNKTTSIKITFKGAPRLIRTYAVIMNAKGVPAAHLPISLYAGPS